MVLDSRKGAGGRWTSSNRKASSSLTTFIAVCAPPYLFADVTEKISRVSACVSLHPAHHDESRAVDVLTMMTADATAAPP